MQILHSQPEAMARFNYETPAELERIVRKCLEKDRERRYQSARDLLVDLQKSAARLRALHVGREDRAPRGCAARRSAP